MAQDHDSLLQASSSNVAASWRVDVYGKLPPQRRCHHGVGSGIELSRGFFGTVHTAKVQVAPRSSFLVSKRAPPGGRTIVRRRVCPVGKGFVYSINYPWQLRRIANLDRDRSPQSMRNVHMLAARGSGKRHGKWHGSPN